jgi:hypothetical protein
MSGFEGCEMDSCSGVYFGRGGVGVTYLDEDGCPERRKESCGLILLARVVWS